tara:strand:+ start:214 stop:495 length:282 start_codon:yes stop_codon:yes gene_type:complete
MVFILGYSVISATITIIRTKKIDILMNHIAEKDWRRIIKMKMEDYYTEDEIAHMCWYYGQYSQNLTYNQRAILVEKYENMIDDKIKQIEKKRS